MTDSKWLQFLRHYGPIPRNDNMYDETIQRSARRQKIAPIEFEHPMQDLLLRCFDQRTVDPVSVILTGTAGDGKTHLCRKVWSRLNGDEKAWASDSAYLTLAFRYPKDRKEWPTSNDEELYRQVNIHFIRDLSGWAPQQGGEWEPEKEALLQKFCHSLVNPDANELFLIAANDGQLIESWRRLQQTEEVQRARQLFEDLLVEDRQERSGVRLKFFNLSRADSADLFDRARDAFLNHPGWDELRNLSAGENELFGSRCPIRHNFEILQGALVRSRLRSLLELCDRNGLHVPIRQILILLTNAVLGHTDCKDGLMTAADVPKVIAAGTISKASLFSNVFGGNLPENRRLGITIFDYLERFQIGHETSNRVDNLLIFGEQDDHLSHYFETLVAQDTFYGADPRFYAAKQEYIEGSDEGSDSQTFLDLLVAQRRGLYFKIPREWEQDLNLWELTVFKFAGEYLAEVVQPLLKGAAVKRMILARLIRGLNRVFTGMLINADRELFLATSGNNSQAKVSRILLERVSVDPNKGERIALHRDPSNGSILLSVFFTPEIHEDFHLTLIRYEFLSRIALEGALPASFSKECYEDLLAYKSQLVAGLVRRQEKDGVVVGGSSVRLNFLALTEQGMPDPKFVEVAV
jgi:hypothetical protein